MKILTPKDFIQATFINDLGRMIESQNFYLAFIIMGVGIEYLGKCLSPENDWQEGKSGDTFKKAVNTLNALTNYRRLLTEFDLYSSLRCGLAHAALPKHKITLSSTDYQEAHLSESNGRINLKCEDFYTDFKAACEEVISMSYAPDDKMNKPFMEIPGETLNTAFPIISGNTYVTHSLAN